MILQPDSSNQITSIMKIEMLPLSVRIHHIQLLAFSFFSTVLFSSFHVGKIGFSPQRTLNPQTQVTPTGSCGLTMNNILTIVQFSIECREEKQNKPKQNHSYLSDQSQRQFTSSSANENSNCNQAHCLKRGKRLVLQLIGLEDRASFPDQSQQK